VPDGASHDDDGARVMPRNPGVIDAAELIVDEVVSERGPVLRLDDRARRMVALHIREGANARDVPGFFDVERPQRPRREP
jgi:hypothetical protein